MNHHDESIIQEQNLGDPISRGAAIIGRTSDAELVAQTEIPVSISLGDIQPRDTDLANPPQMFDATLATRLWIEVTSTLDQAADVQIVGSSVNAPEDTNRHYPLGDTITLPANGRAAATINLNDSWAPWIGVTITPLSSPSTGLVAVRAHAQRSAEKEL